MGRSESSGTPVGVRELRQNLSVYLRRVQAGERFEVTEHGRAVAVLSPLAAGQSVLDRMIAEGRATPATGTLAVLPPRLVLPPGPPLSDVISQMRDEEVEW